MLYALVVLVKESHVETTLHTTLLEARMAAAKRVFRLMRESSMVDLGEEAVLMSKANDRGDYDEVARLYERQVGRRVVFIQPVALPTGTSELQTDRAGG